MVDAHPPAQDADDDGDSHPAAEADFLSQVLGEAHSGSFERHMLARRLGGADMVGDM